MLSPNEASRNSSAKHIDDLSGPLHPTDALWERSYFTGRYDNSFSPFRVPFLQKPERARWLNVLASRASLSLFLANLEREYIRTRKYAPVRGKSSRAHDETLRMRTLKRVSPLENASSRTIKLITVVF